MSPNQLTGFAAERWAFEQLVKHGYSPKYPPSWGHKNCDLIVNQLPIEVKVANRTTRRSKYHRWQWHVAPTAQEMKGEWALILLANYQGQLWPYVLPGSIVDDRPHIQITSAPPHYNGWLSPWMNRWEVIQYLSDGVYRNGGPLFWQWFSKQQGVPTYAG